MIGLLDALGEQRAVVVGHDWGAPVAWNTALLRPDRVRGVVGLSVPYAPRGPVSLLTAVRPRWATGSTCKYFQAPGVADAELARDVRRTDARRSSTGPRATRRSRPSRPSRWCRREPGSSTSCRSRRRCPDWLTEADLDFYAAEFERTGFTGGLNWYRAIDLSWELMAAWQGAPVTPPALYVAGDRDLVVNFPGMDQVIPNLSDVRAEPDADLMLPGVGHWTQQERPDEVNAALLEFLAGL